MDEDETPKTPAKKAAPPRRTPLPRHQPSPPRERETYQAPRVARVRVQATKMGFYDLKRRRVGNVLTLKQAGDFSAAWMERVDPDTPEETTTGQQELASYRAAHTSVLQDKVNRDDLPTGSYNPLDA